MKKFIPPRHDETILKIADFIAPAFLKIKHNIDRVVVSPKDRDLLMSLRKDRLLFFTNHPTTAEPPIAFYIANMMKSRFNFMASRQIFDWFGGLLGHLISGGGAFSILPGTADKESLKMTKKILASPEGKLILFPEGEPISGENDNLMPFQPGIAQLAFWGMDDARKKDPNAELTILPAFIKYVIAAKPERIEADLNRSINRIENTLGIHPGNKNILRRFLTIGRHLVEDAERKYNLPIAKDKDFDYRIGRLRHAVLDNLADTINATGYNKKDDAIGKVRYLFALMEMIKLKLPDPNLPKLNAKEYEWAFAEVVKAYNFIVIKRDYIISNPTPERLYEWLDTLESYVYGKVPRGLGGEPSHLPRIAFLTFAKPFPISEYYTDYKKKRKPAVEKLLTRLRTDLQALVDDSQKLTTPLVKPGDIGD